MEEGKLDILDLSKPKNSSLPISLDKMKKSKVFKNKMTKKFQQSFKKSIPKEKVDKKIKNKFLSIYIINRQLQKHNSNPLKKNIMIINDIIETKTNHFLAIFKDYLITDYVDEFLKRYFIVSESTELLPKFYIYYQNYLKFFCRGLFTDFKANKIIQEYGECQAELYYNKNYGGKEKKSKKNRDENNDNINDGDNNSNASITSSNINKLRLLFTDTVKNSINRIENSKLWQNYIYKYNTNEISNIFYKNKNETMTLNDDTKIYNEDNLMTNENSLINLIDVMIHKKREKKKTIKNKNIKNNNNNYNINDKNIVNIYKNLLDQSPIRSARNLNYNNKNGLYNKTSKKVASIKIFNKNIPMIFKNKKQINNISNDIKDKNIKTPISEKPNKILSKNNFHSRNSKFNNSGNFFMKSNLTQKIYRNTSKSISSRIGLGNIITSKNNNNNKNKFASFNTNLNQNSKKKLKFNGIYFKNTNENFLSTSSSRNLKKNFICSYQSNKNNQKLNNRIRHYQYITYKNKNQLKQKNSKHKQSCSLSNSNSIFNNFHININNNIMLLNNNNNNTHYNSNKNNLKSNSKIKKRIDDIKLTLKKQNKSRNNGVDLKKYKTEIKYLQNNNIKSKKNICSSIRKYIYLVKTKSKDKNNKNKEQLIRNKSNIFNYSCFKIKKTGEDSDVMSSLKNIKKLNNSNKNLNLNKVPKINIIFDYKRK